MQLSTDTSQASSQRGLTATACVLLLFLVWRGGPVFSAILGSGPTAASANGAEFGSPGSGATRTASMSTCDPPGPPPRFGCWWSTTDCEWLCAICDPFGAPPRPGCGWNGSVCNWICPGYTGVDVTVQTLRPPEQIATVYVRLSKLCTATGAFVGCNGSFTVHPWLPVAEKCQAIVDTITNNCAAAGYVVTVNECQLAARFTVGTFDCPATQFALGISNDPGTFDQTWQGPLPDGESEIITGTTESCAPVPGPVGNLRLEKADGGQSLRLTWDNAANADEYLVFEDGAPDGAINTVEATAQSGTVGLTLALPPGSKFYLVAGSNSACGVGPKH